MPGLTLLFALGLAARSAWAPRRWAEQHYGLDSRFFCRACGAGRPGGAARGLAQTCHACRPAGRRRGAQSCCARRARRRTPPGEHFAIAYGRWPSCVPRTMRDRLSWRAVRARREFYRRGPAVSRHLSAMPRSRRLAYRDRCSGGPGVESVLGCLLFYCRPQHRFFCFSLNNAEMSSSPWPSSMSF